MTICSRCVMDGSAEELTLDEGEGDVCNFCCQARKSLEDAEREKERLPSMIQKMKDDGLGKKYNCLIGLSGGVDSSTALHHAVRFGLRPLCFSVDNGWNDPKADENIMRLVEGLKVPFNRYTIDLTKFRELQSAFMRAGQKNIEIPTDHVLMATTYEMAAKYGIRWIISGGNVASESVMPESWGYQPRDLTHIKDVYRRMMGKTLTGLPGLPVCGLLKWNWYRWVRRIRTMYLLDYLGYDRNEAIRLLERKYGWKNYHEKHCENVFTWWFQNYYLFEKFGIDKRKAHYSSLINAGQMTRREAMDLLAERPVYPRLGIEAKVMRYPARPYTDFKTDEKLYYLICQTVRFLKRFLKNPWK